MDDDTYDHLPPGELSALVATVLATVDEAAANVSASVNASAAAGMATALPPPPAPIRAHSRGPAGSSSRVGSSTSGRGAAATYGAASPDAGFASPSSLSTAGSASQPAGSAAHAFGSPPSARRGHSVTSIYRGVTYAASQELKWKATINNRGRVIDVGFYETELEAAQGARVLWFPVMRAARVRAGMCMLFIPTSVAH
jgi:hypothetical protein